MMRNIIYLLSIMILLSCNNSKKKSFSSFSKSKNDTIKEFYNVDNLKSISYIDSIGKLAFIEFYENGNKFRQGHLDSVSLDMIGEWFFFNKEGDLSDKREFIEYDNDILLNQVKFYNKNGEVIRIGNDKFNSYKQKNFDKYEINPRYSHCISFKINNDTIDSGGVFKSSVLSFSPFDNLETYSISVYLDKEVNNLNEGFNVLKGKSFDYFECLMNDKENQERYADYKSDRNKISFFGREMRDEGNKMLKGFVKESMLDSITKTEIEIKKTFFNIPVHVK